MVWNDIVCLILGKTYSFLALCFDVLCCSFSLFQGPNSIFLAVNQELASYVLTSIRYLHYFYSGLENDGDIRIQSLNLSKRKPSDHVFKAITVLRLLGWSIATVCFDCPVIKAEHRSLFYFRDNQVWFRFKEVVKRNKLGRIFYDFLFLFSFIARSLS